MSEKKYNFLDDSFNDAIDHIDATLNGIAAQAQKICDNWWFFRQQQLNDPTKHLSQSIVGTRVRRTTSGGIQCEWYWNDFKKNLSDNTIKVFSVAIRSNRNGGVNMRSLKSRSKSWEFQMCAETERQYIEIRELSKQLIRARRELQKSAQKNDQFLENQNLKPLVRKD